MYLAYSHQNYLANLHFAMRLCIWHTHIMCSFSTEGGQSSPPPRPSPLLLLRSLITAKGNIDTSFTFYRCKIFTSRLFKWHTHAIFIWRTHITFIRHTHTVFIWHTYILQCVYSSGTLTLVVCFSQRVSGVLPLPARLLSSSSSSSLLSSLELSDTQDYEP